MQQLESLLTADELEVILSYKLNFIAYCEDHDLHSIATRELISEPFKVYLADQIDFHETLEQYEICFILKSINDKLRQI